ncbi:hypothetical protein PJM41_0048 [Salmonella phage vB_SenS_UTK0009]|uniref:Phage protein n=1 Tax=Salmonella phage vB_SenS_UTK0009 TaxID=3028908 RepID=A0AAE9ZJW9_9CAUD|nr:hypothetical protein PJM41_0048 [Salmonella phage vB_SenS_UTK0009]
MIVSPFALWFIIGAVVAIYSLIDDLYISKNKDVIYYVIDKYRSPELRDVNEDTLYKCILSGLIIMDTLFGPVSVYFFFRKTRKMKKFRAEMQNS